MTSPYHVISGNDKSVVIFRSALRDVAVALITYRSFFCIFANTNFHVFSLTHVLKRFLTCSMNLRRTYARVLLKTLFPRTHLSVLTLHTHRVFAKRVWF